MITNELTTKVTSIINSMKVGEVKRFRSGAKVYCESYTRHGYAVVSPDGDTSLSDISKEKAIELVLDGYR